MQVMVNAEPVKEEDKKKEGPDKWEVDCWVRTIMDAEEIKADQKKMKHVRPKLAEKAAAMKKSITSIEQLRAKGKEMAEADADYKDDDA